jgi:hypothetical protein
VNTALYACLKVRLKLGYIGGTDLNEYFRLEQTLLQIIRISSILIIQVGREGEIRYDTALRAISDTCLHPSEQ